MKKKNHFPDDCNFTMKRWSEMYDNKLCLIHTSNSAWNIYLHEVIFFDQGGRPTSASTLGQNTQISMFQKKKNILYSQTFFNL